MTGMDLTGQRYGRLVVIGESDPILYPSGHKCRMWKCKCDCGNEAVVRHGNLRNGTTQSCGCLHKEIFGKVKRTHGLSEENKRLYKIWKEMRSRCNNPNNKSYERYGGRGIIVCQEWNDSFVPFYQWSMKNGYKEDISDSGRNRLSIDRIDNDGNYEPGNCRWTTNDVQANNKRKSLPKEIKYVNCPICGKQYIKTQRKGNKTCSRQCGIILRRITHPNTKDYTKICPVCGKSFNAKRGGHFKDAIYCSQKCSYLSKSPTWEYNGESHRVMEWSEIVGINAHCLYHRKEMGWTIEEILTTPFRGKRHGSKLQTGIRNSEKE